MDPGHFLDKLVLPNCNYPTYSWCWALAIKTVVSFSVNIPYIANVVWNYFVPQKKWCISYTRKAEGNIQCRVLPTLTSYMDFAYHIWPISLKINVYIWKINHVLQWVKIRLKNSLLWKRHYQNYLLYHIFAQKLEVLGSFYVVFVGLTWATNPLITNLVKSGAWFEASTEHTYVFADINPNFFSFQKVLYSLRIPHV